MNMKETRLRLHSRFQIGEVDPRVFGGFLEHMGRAVYQGVYQPDSQHADAAGYRQDVLAALARLDMTNVRYPGGNFVSAYHWEDGVGPRQQRPTLFDPAWNSVEPNEFGTDEFMALCRKLDWAPMLSVNLGTGTPEEARNWVEYCNAKAGTRYADMRVANGCREPHAVRLWCLGNEMDGFWQTGHVPADQYALRAQQAAKMMRDVDPSIELVACGSCAVEMPTYVEWDRVVLEYLGGMANYVSLHRYVRNPTGDTPDFLAVTRSIDRQIEDMDAVCRFVQAKRRSPQRSYLCFDEWNVWYRTMSSLGERREPSFAPPLIEEIYNLEDALVVAGFLNSFIRHADCVKIANLAQITNVIAPILTRGDDMLIQSIFYPFEMFSKRRQGVSLRCLVEGPRYQGQLNGEVDIIDCSAIVDGPELKIFATNRSPSQEAELVVELADGDIRRLVSAELVTGPDAKAANSHEDPDVIGCQPFDAVVVSKGRARVALAPLSILAMTLEIDR
jgi:alpha-N-arabinofuranosidase